MAEQTEAAEGRLRVLVVDDNADAADSLCALLRLWGHEAEAAYDGQAGLKAASALVPDCLFLDIGLPGIDGYDLARRLRQHPVLHKSRLVALSAYADTERSRAAGFDHHLVKPADPQEVEALLKMMAQVLRLAEQSAELALETRDLIGEAREEMKELKGELREVKSELREVKSELREVKEALDKDTPGAAG